MRLARDSKGRFLPRGRRRRNEPDPARRRPKRRTTKLAARPYYKAPYKRRGYAPNEPGRRRRKRASSSSRRGYRRNPDLLRGIGLGTSELKTAGYVVIGVVGTPFIEGFILHVVPTTWAANKIVGYAVKFGAAFGLGWIGKAVFGREAGRLVFIGGISYLAISVIRDFIPGLTTPAVSGLSAQPLLGRYTSPPRPTGLGSYITSRTPERFQPSGRF